MIIHGRRVSCQVTDTHHRRSPLVQGGVEIPVRVTVTVKLGEGNVRVINKCEELVNEHYKKPENGTFDDVTASVLEQMMSDEDDDDDNDSDTEEDDL